MARPFQKVIVVGAGPSGLLLCIFLSKHGIPVCLLEASDKLDDRPRAAIYGPPAMVDLKRAGVLDKIRRRGMTLNTMAWRRIEDHSYITGLDGAILADMDGEDLRTTCLVLDQLDQLLLDEFLNKYNGSISWNHKVVTVGQDEKTAWVDVETPDGPTKVYGDYVVGCDGANSSVRKSLFGDDFPGFTWDKQVVATNVYYDFEAKYGLSNANFIVHPEHFTMIAKITVDGLYRVTYGETPGLSNEELRERQPWKYETILPGHPKPGDYKLVSIAPYKMHQRCAPSFRVGKVLLAADAAHLCNPWGGMGITGGFIDIGGLYDCLIGIWDGKADESILDLYSEKRIEKWKKVINVVSSDNFRRVSDSDPATILDRDPVMLACKKAESDKEAQLAAFKAMFDVRYDFTQHYKS
ncbi:FAD binding domain-containing protein [Pseudomassariella vexata]|uniref:FAD binding domain-containing protein n=1 Tax=Pseudomassariella vexata TaxID=1141098 RepID=A0A1Y2DF50_9PEZI|nr:FAD binding domain-containing protein [Pseudomassariella vexata]ORY57902.1 FAD binding domain-containing protein [Pseudomassariella vexata]